MLQKQIALLVIMLASMRFAWAEHDTGIIRTESIDAAILQEWQDSFGLRAVQQWYDWRIDQLTRLCADDAPDFFTLRTAGADYCTFLNKGMLTNLESSNAICSDYTSMPSVFRKALAKDKVPYGVLQSVAFAHELYWLPEAWEKAGLSPALIPNSFESLLKFLEIYLAAPPAGCCIFQHVSDPGSQYTYRRWLLDLLTAAWDAQAYYSDKTPEYRNEAFVTLLKKALTIGAALDQRESVASSEKHLLMPLFYGGGRSGRGLTDDGKYSYTLNDLIPLRVAADQPALVAVHAELLCCRAESPYAKVAAQLLETALQHRPAFVQFYLHPDLESPEAFNAQISNQCQSGRFTQAWLSSLTDCALTPILLVERHRTDNDLALADRLCKGEISPLDFAAQLGSAQ